MHENRPGVYAPYIDPFSPSKIRDLFKLDLDGEALTLAVSRGPSEVGYDVALGEDIELVQGYAILTFTKERIGMPLHLSADVVGKSTWARLGISLNTTKVDPGFSGNITLEITYNPLWKGQALHVRSLYYPRRLKLRAGLGIGTLVFTNLAHSVRYDGKYDGKGTEAAR